VGRVLSQAFPELVSFVKNKRISVQAATSTPMLQNLFHLPLSLEALCPISEGHRPSLEFTDAE
jgi:hypothetical protein